ncbi:MAG: hypothetical protein ACYS67_13715 [Planctomycetota bacterium]
MKTNGKFRIGIQVGVVVLLFGALAVGVGIKISQPGRGESESQVEQQETKPAKTLTQEESKPYEMTAEDEEFVQWLDEEIQRLEEETEVETEGMPEKEQMYVSQGQAEVSPLKESISWKEFKAAVKEGWKKEKKQKGKTDWAKKMSLEELHKVRWEIEEYIEKLRAKGVTNPKKYEGAFKKMDAVDEAMWEKEEAKREK